MRTRSNAIAVAATCGLFAAGIAMGMAIPRSVHLNEQTKRNILATMKGEAFAHVKYLLFADRAREHGLDDLAALFSDVAKVERHEHLAEFAALYGVVGSDAANLADAIAGERYEVETLYRQFADEARAAGDDEAAERWDEVRRDEAKHLAAFESALANLKETTNIPVSPSR